jgi:DNA uptake protein ComE-like DNA-binding protein
MRTLILSSLLLIAAPAFAQDKADTTTKTKTETTTTTKKPKRSELMDLNTASADQLKTLPGMTDDVAKKIIAARPYTGKDQLLKQNIVDKDEYAKIRPLVVAKQPKAMGGQGSVEKHEGPGPATDAKSKK